MREYCKVELLNITPNALQLIERAGRISHKSEDKITADSAPNFVEMLIRLGHESVLEHASATFEISNISRVCSHQLVRHRIASYTQESQRHCKADKFIIPPTFCNVPVDFPKIITGFGDIPQEDLRYFYINATVTSIIVTMNFRSLRHFLKERLSKAAQWEIKGVACCIFDILLWGGFEDILRDISPLRGTANGTLNSKYSLMSYNTGSNTYSIQSIGD
jgi:thymidylate synthase (FAD)